MKLKFIKAQEIDRNVKATIHTSGKLGFSSDAAKKLRLSDNTRSVMIALNEDDTTDENLYIKTLDEQNDDAFSIIKAGEYYYVNTKAFFDNYNIDYRNSKIIYDIVEFEYEGEKMFKFIKREVKKKKKIE
ncbi:hypothetical protein [Chitinophaga ginsengisoli]|uniref:Uncharacterized protein n=1 Tax=Chitinophaga ginsengisoli TaxID=363837 RepID=A0A2P8FPQ1_9BACT|nr:hypothetical protein [Chitinophaga ginsengisoli]PSL23711.1 hypothetical protein CLV42_11767 [Chitinophaga ginsengisoli]